MQTLIKKLRWFARNHTCFLFVSYDWQICITLSLLVF